MKKIAVINDLSGLGKCSLTAAIPVISAMGVQAVPLPTAVLSNQTGYPSYFLDDYTDRMPKIMEEWEKRGFSPDGIYTGFLAGERQAERIHDFLNRFCRPETLLLVDPVMGDQGKVYDIYTEELCDSMRRLVQRANVITPNLTEALLLLYGEREMKMRYETITPERIEDMGRELCSRFGLRAAVITGVDLPQQAKQRQIGNLVCGSTGVTWYVSEKKGGSYSGTGDLFASILSAGLVKGVSIEQCVAGAASFLEKAIADAVFEGTDRNDGVCFESYLHELWKIGKEDFQ